MTNYADEKKIRKNSLQWTIDTSDFTEVTLLIYSLEIITKVGRYFPIFFSHWRSLNVLLANDLLENSIEFGILNSIFAAVGFISLIQIHQKNKISSFDSSYNKTNSKFFLDIRN
ncbi:MAG: hypothetical protein ACRBB5_02030 [Nitrosopumilus sp.]